MTNRMLYMYTHDTVDLKMTADRWSVILSSCERCVSHDFFRVAIGVLYSYCWTHRYESTNLPLLIEVFQASFVALNIDSIITHNTGIDQIPAQ